MQIVVFPWLAMGHLLPFLRLSNLLSRRGHHVTFVSTPRNLSRLPNLSSRITFRPLHLTNVPNLPPNAESSMDIPYNKQQLLKAAFDLLEDPMRKLLENEKPDWIIYDFASHWIPPLAANLGVSTAFFCLFTAACLVFTSPPSGIDSRTTAEDFTAVPSWIPFESDLAFRLHEVTRYIEKSEEDQTGVPDTVRFDLSMKRSDVIVLRTSPEFEPEWISLLRELRQKPILPLGFLPPTNADEEDGAKSNVWPRIKNWLDLQRPNSVVYVALGTEACLSHEEVGKLAIGLEKSDLPFFWTLRNTPETLPPGFEERVKERGMVHFGWIPQVNILSHSSIGGFLTHCGMNSVIEGMCFGRVLILFPILNDQGLNVRLLQSKQIGVEIPRDEINGCFSCENVAETLRMVMVEETGKIMRTKAVEMKELFRDNDSYVDDFVRYMERNRISR